MRRAALSQSSIKAMVTLEKITEAILFLSSPRSRTTSGQAIAVDADLQALT